jgi:hypothetical protein
MLTQALPLWQLKQAFWTREDEEVGVLETLRFLYMVLSFIADTGRFEELQNVPAAVAEHPLHQLAIPLLADESLHQVLELEDLRKRSASEPITFSAPRKYVACSHSQLTCPGTWYALSLGLP